MATDEQLIQQIQQGKSEAFGQLFRKYYGQIYSICLSILKNPHDAEEAASDTFISAYLKMDQLSKPDKFLSWLKKIARNRSRDILRSKNKEIILPHHSAPVVQANPERLILRQELIDAIMEVIQSLPQKDREVIQARINGLSHAEISEKLSISISASINRLYHARKKIAARVGQTF
jgi:RNA polymerase sigma-70 factor (ECF subfamily)